MYPNIFYNNYRNKIISNVLRKNNFLEVLVCLNENWKYFQYIICNFNWLMWCTIWQREVRLQSKRQWSFLSIDLLVLSSAFYQVQMNNWSCHSFLMYIKDYEKWTCLHFLFVIGLYFFTSFQKIILWIWFSLLNKGLQSNTSFCFRQK